MSNTDTNSPLLGFVVEGDGEYQSLRSLLSRGLGIDARDVPIANAFGCSNLATRLEDFLRDLVKSRHPQNVIITVDARDFRGNVALGDCCALKEHLQRRADLWLLDCEQNGLFLPLPLTVQVIVQDPAFEGWLISDLEGLRRAVDVVTVEEGVEWSNVDKDVANPGLWLKQRLRPGIRLKDPSLPKRLAKHLHPPRMAHTSRSFRKFWKEVCLIYQPIVDG
jgi:hypothetical protein